MSKDRADLTQKVILIAAQVLQSEGPDALTVRRIAQESGASTQLIYTLFGGKNGLLDGLYSEGFRRLQQLIVERDGKLDPKENIESMLLAYREFAQQSRPFFAVMFWLQNQNPPRDSLMLVNRFLETLSEGVKKCQEVNHLMGDPAIVARDLWAGVHGITSLELMGHFEGPLANKLFQEFVRNVWTRAPRETTEQPLLHTSKSSPHRNTDGL